jgi:type I restriction enzyme, S subunit
MLGELFTERQETGLTNLPLLSLTERDGIVPQEETNRRDNSSADKSKYLRVVPGDVAYNTMRMWEGRSAYVGLEGLVSPAYTVCRPNEHAHGLFFSYYFKTSPLIEQFRRYSQGLVKDTLSLKFEAFARIPIAFPERPEQRKIAACLTSLDEWIAAERRKLEALRTHKKGLMQQLLPREGETQPRRRFPEFLDAPEWYERALSHFIAALDAGVSINAGDRPARDGEIGILKTSCVTSGTFESAENKVVLNPEELARAREQVQRDTIIMSRMNTIALVGANAYVDRDIPNLFLPDRLWAAKPAAHCDMRFLSYILGSGHRRSFLSSLGSGSSGSMKNISKSAVLAMLISAPASIAEQRRIAACLSSLDALIVAEARKLDSLRAMRKGLMQQLFPPPEGT